MSGLTCNSCNKEFVDDADQRLHYKSDWHRYNLKRKVAGVPGVTEALFVARQSAISQEKKNVNGTPMLYSCGLCDKGYRSSKAHEQHLKSRSHIMRASQGLNNGEQDKAIIKPLPRRVESKPVSRRAAIDEESEESEDEWVEVDSDDELIAEAADSLTELNVNGNDLVPGEAMDEDNLEDELDPSCCFMCDKDHGSLESCMVHMHKHHGFFIPDVEFLKDPHGLLTYLGLKVRRDFLCLYCNYRCQPFSSLEAVRKHMEAKSHCKVHYGDGGDDEEAELEDFYDYSSSYGDNVGTQIVASGDLDNSVELGSGSEIVIRKRSHNKVSTRTLGSREYLRYYKQKPRPSANQLAISASLAARYRSMGLATVQSREDIVRMKVMKEANRSRQAMHLKVGMKSNVIRNLPKNVPY